MLFLFVLSGSVEWSCSSVQSTLSMTPAPHSVAAAIVCTALSHVLGGPLRKEHQAHVSL